MGLNWLINVDVKDRLPENKTAKKGSGLKKIWFIIAWVSLATSLYINSEWNKSSNDYYKEVITLSKWNPYDAYKILESWFELTDDENKLYDIVKARDEIIKNYPGCFENENNEWYRHGSTPDSLSHSFSRQGYQECEVAWIDFKPNDKKEKEETGLAELF